MRELMKRASSPAFKALLWVLGWSVAMVVAATLLRSSYYLTLGSSAAILTLAALSVVVLTGFAGQFSLATAAFYGIGAYGTAILTVHYGLPPLPTMLISAVIAAAIAFAIGRPVLRLNGHFLAMATLVLNEIFIRLVLAAPEYTGGNDGMGGIPSFSLFGFEFDRVREQFYLSWAVAGIALALSLRIVHSRSGRALGAIRADEQAASAVGVDIASAKTTVFAFSAILASVAGSLYAHFLSFVNPEPFSVMASVMFLFVAVLGGLSSPWGALIGGIVFSVLQQVMTTLIPRLLGEGAIGSGSQLVIGFLLVVLLVLWPTGLLGAISRFLPGSKRKRNLSPEVHTHGNAIPGPSTTSAERPALASVGLSKTFGGLRALSDCTLEVRQGEILAVIGPNGAGKSTLIHSLTGTYSASDGRLVADGVDVTGLSAAVMASEHGIGRTFQTPKLVPELTLVENAALGAHRFGRSGLVGAMFPNPVTAREEAAVMESAYSALDAVGLRSLAHRRASELSLGHRRLLEIARVLAQRPKVILLDEPAAGLNSSEKAELSRLLRAMRDAGYGLLLVEHDMKMVMKLADRVHVIEFGSTIFTGDPEVAQADERVIASYLGYAPAGAA